MFIHIYIYIYIYCMLWKNPLCTQRSALCAPLCVALCAQACALGLCAGLVRCACALGLVDLCALVLCARHGSVLLHCRSAHVSQAPLGSAGLCAKGALCVLMKKLCFWLCAPFVRLPAWRPAQKIQSLCVVAVQKPSVCRHAVLQ